MTLIFRMKNIYRKLNKVLRSIYYKFSFYSKKAKEKLIIFLATSDNIDLQWLWYLEQGYHQRPPYVDYEHNMVSQFLKKILANVDKKVFIDGGCNTGMYTKLLLDNFENPEIYCFEPSPILFKNLNLQFQNKSNVFLSNFALGEKRETAKLFSYLSKELHEHGSINKNFLNYQSDNEIESYDCEVDKIDNLSKKYKNIKNTCFIKLDLEGYELKALRGAAKLLKSGNVIAIQFEFNSGNVFTKAFLRDFYDLLYEKYDFFRLNHKGMIKLGSYNCNNEVFVQHNIVAVLKEYSHLYLKRWEIKK